MSEIFVFESSLLNEKYSRINHDSGLKIFVFPKDMSTSYGILSVNFGGGVTSYTVDGENIILPHGCAHFLEHKLFENEDGSNADDIFSYLGAYDNAYTSSERTAYLFSTTDKEYKCLEELIRFVTSPYFTKKTVKKEIGIIAEEIRGCLDDPYDRCYMNLLDSMYFYSPVKNEICGTEKSISAITPEVLYQCCKDFYVPSNMVLALSGRFEPHTVIDVVDGVLGKASHERVVSVPEFNEPPQVKRAYIERKMPVGKPLFCIGIKDVDIPSDAFERYRKTEGMNLLLNLMLSESSEFYLNMLESGLVSPGFDSGYSSGAQNAYTMISGESDDPVVLLDKIKEHIAHFRQKGIEKEAFEREKRCIYASYVSDFDSTEDIAFALTSYAHDGMELFRYPDIIDGISIEYVQHLLDTSFDGDRFTLSVIRPLK